MRINSFQFLATETNIEFASCGSISRTTMQLPSCSVLSTKPHMVKFIIRKTTDCWEASSFRHFGSTLATGKGPQAHYMSICASIIISIHRPDRKVSEINNRYHKYCDLRPIIISTIIPVCCTSIKRRPTAKKRTFCCGGSCTGYPGIWM